MYLRAHVQQNLEQLFGLSPSDKEEVLRILRSELSRDFLGLVAVTRTGAGLYAGLRSLNFSQSPGTLIYLPSSDRIVLPRAA
jgi:hypothetical protein